MPNVSDLTSRLTYLKPEDTAQIEAAYRFSESAHTGQFRVSGEPYISHPLAVAGILAEWHLDGQALMAALLHDVMEDTAITKQEIGEKFGKAVAELVDGVSKLDKIEFQTEVHAQAENFRKMLLAMARDVRVILIKIADRLHNMRTLGAMAPDKRQRIARETLEIYAPIANRLGLNSVYDELEDLSFRHLYPNRFDVLAKAVKAARGNRREVVGKVLEAIKQKLKDSQIEAAITGREKHLYSIYKKMQGKSLTFSEVFDIYGFRVIVKDVPTCYLTLGALHQLYKPIPGKFKDYIAIPKANGYQSLHTTLFGPFGTPIEIQIRSQDMHKIAEAGVASHWLYKSGEAEINEMQQKTHQWLQSLLEIQSESGDATEFLEHIKVDLFPDEVYVFTPKGKIMALPRGATGVDFAYAVHTDVGNRCVAVKINQELMPLRTELRNGDQVEIVTAAHAKPNPTWLNYVITGKARSHIRHFLKTMQYDESAALGERLLNQALRALGADPAEISEAQWDKLLRECSGKHKQEILADIGLGKRLNIIVARHLLAITEMAEERKHVPVGPITIRGTEGMAVQFAKCCRPIPGDPIIGFIKKGQGLVIHTHDCPVIAKDRADTDKWLDVEWDPSAPKKPFDINIKLVVANQRGVLAKVAAAIADAGSNIDNVSMEEEDGSAYTTMNFTLQVENRIHLANVMRSLRKITEVVRITRVKG
ncbi:bifunctional (p)ppGpp synthetase/guanosine-3',5'-bis(diphosphate) 3'-pyrophosphohydrolase [Sulfuricella sp.]|uniref:RelA/SpoT family protein n=1 Tax=Sulfuricella sp. TaxID=2099377 RepID=UPI002BF9D1D1|nr:bifunctional (p)ppGpp synthetase/guanosine-3',5'-bis(diphosphate) 3'-pyrophosphohydrolase [Sulfuricella sp.]HUX62354.1 bifunctional (p)ppGpp synthetase/guanosine-3',5'-bis(diphosphate) 3'-pyrophosphohydrolase [Sulfuricella sp.]